MRLPVPLVMVFVLALSAHGVESAQVVGTTTATPTTVPVGVGTVVTVVSAVSDPSLIVPSVNLQRLDAAGRVIAILGTLVDDGSGGDATAGDGLFTIRTTIFETVAGPVRLRVSAAFSGKLLRAFSAPLTVMASGTSTTLGITAPGNLAYLNTTPINVTGAVGDAGASVEVNGVPGTVSGNTFLATVPLLEGTNTLTAVATNSNGTNTTASVQVTLDTTPPRLTVTAPEDGFTTVAPAVAVSGLINDIVVGTINDQQATVTVNGTAAQVSNRSFLVPSVPLALGPNLIQVTGTDRTGNGATASVTVHRVVPTTPTIQVVSGSNQTGPAGSILPASLVARVTNEAGQPVSGVPVVFEVTQNSGGLVSGTASLGALAMPSNAEGQASVDFRTGTRSGVGNNVVQATAVGFAGTAVFLASGTPAGASRIVVDTGNGQSGVVGSALPLPFVAIVTDAGYNRLGGVPVTFRVSQGGGLINGLSAFMTNTDSDGRVAAVLTLGKQEGFDNNVVEATFAGNTGAPAAFLATGRVPADPAETRITGVVLDNSNAPIPGVTMRLFRTHHGTGVPEQVVEPVTTNEIGQFLIQPAPVGAFKLMADGSTAPDGPWPTLEFDIVTVAGQNNDVGLPIYLPALDSVNQLCVTETTGGTLTLPQVPGFALTLAPGAATFPGGSRTGCVTVTPVNGDKVPMSPGFGQQPRFVVTIQPVGTIFNPPAQLTLPNVDGLAPRAMTEMYSYDHDLAAFVSIGTGTVSDDGSVIVSDPGVGVIKAGWHCGGNPNPTGSAGTCPTCQRCQGTQCVADNGQTPPQASPTDCREQRCSGGAVVTVNRDSEQPTDVCEQCTSGAPVDRSDGSTPADQNACCFEGQRLNKFGQELGTVFDGPLVEQCPQRTQDTTSGGPFGNGLHSVDGCSGGIPPNIQDPMTNLPYPFGLLNVAPTAFGVPIGGGATPVGSGAVGSQPCNQHDLCYQTCDATSGSAFGSAGREACDDAMETRMDAVCAAAYPSSCPSTLGILECVSYQAQRLDCFTYSNLYWTGLRAGGASAFAERQTQFCKCCP
jgi:hypothetical protein